MLCRCDGATPHATPPATPHTTPYAIPRLLQRQFCVGRLALHQVRGQVSQGVDVSGGAQATGKEDLGGEVGDGADLVCE